MMNKVYPTEIEEKMQLHFSLLNEKDRRHYAAVEALRLGYGGKKYIGKLFKIGQARIRNGIAELNTPTLLSSIPVGKQRRSGGGRKKKKRAILT